MSIKQNFMTKYKFKGWDWTELLPLVGMEEEYKKEVENSDPNFYEAETVFGEKMSERIRLYDRDHTEEETKIFVMHLRDFLQKVISGPESYLQPYFQGILNVEYNEVFLEVFAKNLTCMWT